MGSLNIISLVLLCCSSSDIPVFLSPHAPKKLVFFYLGPTSMNRRNSSCNNVLEILNLFFCILRGIKFILA